ncbi:ERF family protein [Brevibacterium sp. SMBL_HHYL_HB1]|uniref:ERF family protein n=1 Tax=Brevibacterium sp. SMBL_HHYL_HB1 TaxID=2777556 RepID=UPI001BA855AE|nr:ERF family protein [Brevibacterium sp. SMBL_HHYL_HB1]QUL79893.1 ERF family protein [Brevibacterium sp. SMBL_HHYL_HB1]
MTTVQEAITQVMAEVGAVGKGEQNRQQGFNFRGIDATVNALSPAMRKHGVTVRPCEVHNVTYEAFQSKSGGRLTSCRVIVSYAFRGPDGDEIVSTVAAESMDSGDKGTAKAMSVAFRIALLQTFALPTQETDPDHDVYETVSAPPRDWKGEADALASKGNVDGLRTLWEDAKSAGLVDVMDGINATVQKLQGAK